MRDEDFIQSLTAELEPKPSLGSSQNALLGWLFGSFAVLMISVLKITIRPDIHTMLETRSYHLQLFSALALAIVAAGTALHLRIPGSKAPRKVLAAMTLLWLACVSWHGYSGPQAAFQWKPALHCLASIVALSLVPGIILYLLVRRGATTEPKTALAVIGMAMAASAAAFLPLNCGNDTILHLILGHSSPVLLLGFLFWFLGRPLLRW